MILKCLIELRRLPIDHQLHIWANRVDSMQLKGVEVVERSCTEKRDKGNEYIDLIR